MGVHTLEGEAVVQWAIANAVVSPLDAPVKAHQADLEAYSFVIVCAGQALPFFLQSPRLLRHTTAPSMTPSTAICSAIIIGGG